MIRKLSLRAAQFLAVVLALFLGVAVAAPATAAGTYDRTAAAQYAQKYSCNENTSCRNSKFKSMGADCTNFVSQTLWAGGKSMYQGKGATWAWITRDNYTNSWVQVPKMREFLNEKGRSTVLSVNMDGSFTAAKKGDLYMYDWGKGSGWSHLSIETGNGTFANIVDSHTKKNYRSITGGKGDYIAQHTTDRDGSPWNWGYQTEKDPKIKKKMKTVLIRINDGW